MRRRPSLVAMVAALAALSLAPVSGAVVTYTSLADWNTAMGRALSNIDESFNTLLLATYNGGSGVVMGGYNIVGFNGTDHATNFQIRVMAESDYDLSGNDRLLRVAVSDGLERGFQIQFQTAVTAVALQLFQKTGYATAKAKVTPIGAPISASDPAFPDGYINLPYDMYNLQRYFIGLISDTPFSVVDIQAYNMSGPSFYMDNLSFGDSPPPPPPPPPPEETPEIATLILIGSGLCLLRFLRRGWLRPAA